MTERCDSEFLKKKKHNQTQPNANNQTYYLCIIQFEWLFINLLFVIINGNDNVAACRSRKLDSKIVCSRNKQLSASDYFHFR